MRTKSARIALVENDPPSNRAFARLLKAHGYAVEAFFSAEDFLARTSTVRIDCLLLDINLDGMSGLELQRQMKRSSSLVPIVFMTGRCGASVEQHAREQGCAGFLYKPFNGRAMAGAIELALSG